ncbi:MAG: glucose-6-phosphate dehydrogenase [Bryobacterales bacterium]|nr:glucose-6-phosphate dehydrogenase [Bryobacterales bacterium]
MSAGDGDGASPKPRPAGPCALIIFGAAGDLTRRLLLPSLYNLAREGLLSERFAVIGVARAPLGRDEFIAQVRRGMPEVKTGAAVDWLVSRLHYVQLDFNEQAGYGRLATELEDADRTHGTAGNYLFYLATAPEYFLEVTERLGSEGLLNQTNGRWRRIVVEKPFGHNLGSARELNRGLSRIAGEEQVYRIDHYLGKETVQNILVLRFANGIFEPVWNRRYVEHVQITVAETVGVELRGGYYDHTGALRDMVPNHLLQLLTLTAMEPPSSFSPAALQNEQVKVLGAIPPLGARECGLCAVRAQYTTGALDGGPVPGYREEPRVAPDSETETYVAMKLAIDNWRWAGVPFYIRTGKRLTARNTEVVIQFRKAPLTLFRTASVTLPSANRLHIHIQPEENISLQFAAKVPGPTVTVRPVEMRFCYRDYFGRENRTGYETLLYDAMIGDASLFKRGEMIEAGWSVVEPLLQAWEQPLTPLSLYPAGSAGPEAANQLLRRDGYEWMPLK